MTRISLAQQWSIVQSSHQAPVAVFLYPLLDLLLGLPGIPISTIDHHLSLLRMTDHVLHLQGAENYSANDAQPLVGSVIQRPLTVTQCYPCGSGAVADEARCVDEVTDHEVLIGAAKIVVHVLERVHYNGFLHATYVKGNKDGDGKDEEEQTSCLACRESS